MSDEDWRRLVQEASQLRTAGRVTEAIAAYQRALAANPDLPESWFNLGWLQRRARAFDDALGSYQRALDLGVGRPEEVHLNRAAIYSEYLRRPRDAQRELQEALEKHPGFVPALVNLGNLHEDLGERDAARDAYSRALELDPTNTLSLARMATASLSPDLDTEMEARLRSVIARPDATATQRAGVGFALAALLDAAAKYDEAFAAAAAANEASRAGAGSRGRYDRARQEALVDQLIATFNEAPSGASSDPAPVFICGMFRSGSTLVEQILAGHSRVIAGGELDHIPTIVANIPNYPAGFALADADALNRMREFYWAGLQGQVTSTVFTDKRPDNLLHLGLIKAMFPAAKIVHTVREPLDNLLSLYFLHLDPSMAYALDLADAAHWYGQYRRLMAHWDRLFGDDILNVRYETLVAQPDAEIRKVLAFLNLEWEDGLLDFSDTDRAVRTASVWQVREKLYTRSSGRWRNYAKYLEPLKEALAVAGFAADER